MTVKTYSVQGMTCQNCVNHVTEEVSEIDGVENVAVDLASGRLDVTATEVDDAAVKAAVEEAGYSVSAPGDLGLRPA